MATPGEHEIWLVYRWARNVPPHDALVRARRFDDGVAPTVTASGLGSAFHSKFYLCAREDVPEDAIVTASDSISPSRSRKRGSASSPGGAVERAEDLGRRRGPRIRNGQRGLEIPKPPLKRPTLKALRRRRRNGLTVVSTFASSGGSSTGYVASGFEVRAAVEFIPRAAESYRANHPKTVMLERDIREVTASELMEAAGVAEGELDVLDGSPPCEPFSMAGKREAGWGKEAAYSGTTQRSDDLFFEYVRLLRGMQPRAFVAENVKGLVAGKAKGYFNEILKELKACGYRVSARVLDAQWLGVPQHRERVIFVGFREDLDIDPVFPQPLPYRYSVREALPHLGVKRLVHDVNHGVYASQGDMTDKPSPTIQSRPQQGAFEGESREIHVEGESEDDVAIEHPRSGHGFKPATSSIDEPMPTVQAQQAHARNSEPRLLYDDGRTPETSGVRQRPLDVTDEVAPTVTTGGSDASHNVGVNACHWTVEESVEAISDDRLEASNGEGFKRSRRSLDQPAPTVVSHDGSKPITVEGEAEEFDEMIVGNNAYEAKFGPPDKPAPTVTATQPGRTMGDVRSSKTKRRRRLTIDELKAICGFPPDYVLTGKFAEQWERLGDAVPPPMMEHISGAVRDALLEHDAGIVDAEVVD